MAAPSSKWRVKKDASFEATWRGLWWNPAGTSMSFGGNGASCGERGAAITMRNAWIICRKERGSYFVSPVAYLLLTMFGVIFGFFFWNALGYFVIEGMQMQMRGQTFPMNANEQIIRPLLSNVSVVGLFFIPMITMRLFAEEKRTGTIELLATSPVRDLEIILGKWTAAMVR